ncbi:hypothetical protein MNB_ARC-1_1118 [hydrothermal vent metagenome]|uniref:Uncharacterized protein n=1 Tax=hydrothermal vent metagenome TaxID=652676 RepID=A0A3B1E4P3_9ZZZZ
MGKKIISSLSVVALLISSSYASHMGGGKRFNNQISSYFGDKQNNQITRAYFGDKQNNQIDIVDVENMKLIKTVKTNNQKTYSAETIKTMYNHNDLTPKMYVSNRGSDRLDVLDSETNKIIKSIELPFHPRSIDVNKRTGLVLVSGVDKPMAAVIYSATDEVLAIVGKNEVTYPTTSGHSNLSSGTLATGHPHWINESHFSFIDRQNKTIITYQIGVENGQLLTRKLNELKTPSPVHNLIPPSVHGHKGRSHGIYNSTVFYATAEGSEGVYPSVLKLEFIPNVGMTLVENLEIKKDGLLPKDMGVHHLNFLNDQRTIYVGSDEGNLFVVDYSGEKMRIVKSVKAGLGAGHMAEMKHGRGNIAIIINHKDSFITLIDARTNNKIADVKVSLLPQDKIGVVQTQSHPKYHFSRDGRYFYMFLTEEGSLVKVDLQQKRVVERLNIGGKIAMGTFLEEKGKHRKFH